MTASTRVTYETFGESAKGVVDALTALGAAVDASGLDKDLTELLKLRVSQINGCTFCVQYHLNLLRRQKVTQEKLDLVAVWREAGIFSKRETIALAYAEAITRALHDGVSDTLYADVLEQFPGEQVMFLTAAIANINAWNRIAIPFQYPPMIPTRT
ncbi:carboxymuconolactone decarboxylase family protein [Burkholderia sp. FERM BP-3421]|jgi:AhpD family alkylhydroperoxidase|uniref:carboxymuconolactone decarboxylase family protein n=1 Tax=Burkholderia sp. FERM BP-3421 TaxID=1494466 RepID=UPI002360756D|nr:carboxymuconolactone decarboxylase family protein [Burkholderia sp. FERM BP-3421]WDD91489.1 carboxymuconolactone decarboxylase family protein [Burkholderia sp. FERM BP-3421]